MERCEICGEPRENDLFSAVTQERVCSICKLKYIGGFSTTPERIDKVRESFGLIDGQYLEQNNPDKASKILGR